MLNWLLRVLGLGPQETSSDTTPIRPIAPERPAPSFRADPAASETAPFGQTTAVPEFGAPRPVEPRFAEPELAGPIRVDHVPSDTSRVAPPEPELVAPEPIGVPTLNFAAFTIQSSAHGRVFARPQDGRLAHVPGSAAPEGWEVHGFVTDQHPGILFVLADEGPTAMSGAGAIAHAFRIEESGEDAFALFDLGAEAYLCAPQFEPGVNMLVNDRGVVDEWEMFHLTAAEGVTMPAALPPLLPPAGTPITASSLDAWRSPAREA